MKQNQEDLRRETEERKEKSKLSRTDVRVESEEEARLQNRKE